ncbi:MAG: pyridoxine 5'-phosphate synthase [Candidatus Methylacidiphilales bacterium]|nr:pyridoxine 5'-phosphate synthase [Candidatus Methylacidiphilales bacterium]
MIHLGVNIDHVATLRQARYRNEPPGHVSVEPDPVEAALEAVAGGAQGITAHLREDRRHIIDRDVMELKSRVPAPLNLEMAVTAGMVAFALRLKPAEACLVPESREEVTTEGGLDVAGQREKIRAAVGELSAAGIRVSLFIDPDPTQIEAAVSTGAPVVELHTGAYSRAVTEPGKSASLSILRAAAEQAHAAGLQVNAGHGLNYRNVSAFLATPHLHTLNIGHAIVSRAVFFGMQKAVKDMVHLLGKPIP